MAFALDVLVERDIVDRIALVFEHAGLAPVAGRIVGYLLVCWPAEQSSADLAHYLGASRGAISTSTRLLIETGLVERIRTRGSRAAWYRVRTGVWSELMHLEVRRLSRLRQLADEGLEALDAAPPERKARLREFQQVNAFFERELPALIARWDAQQKVEEEVS